VNVQKFVWYSFLGRALTKLMFFSLVFFVGTILGKAPDAKGMLGAVLFYLAYFSTYIYNDLLDFESDKRKKFAYSAKALVHGYASLREFIILLGNFSILFTFLATLWDPLLGMFTVLAVITNNIRTHVGNKYRRQILLMIVELLNFEAFWQAMYGEPLPLIFLPLFLTYSSIYSTLHMVYKVTDNYSPGDLIRVIRKRSIQKLAAITFLALITTIPSLLLSTYHFLALLLSVMVYAGIHLYYIRRAENPRTIERTQRTAILLISLVLIGSAFLYSSMGSPFNISVPFMDRLKPFYNTTGYFDALQKEMFNRAFSGIGGLKGKIQ